MTIRSFRQLFSVLFAIVLGGLGVALGYALRTINSSCPNVVCQTVVEETKNPVYFGLLVFACGVLGVLFAVITGPRIAQSLVNAGNAIERMSTRDKLALAIGTLIGLIPAVLSDLLLQKIPYAGIPLAVLVTIAFIYLGIRGTTSMKNEFRFIGPPGAPGETASSEVSMEHAKILDTNVIIDGRIADVCRTGFIEGPIYVPGFVLDELQHIADSSDSLKRARGRRGLDILNQMQKEFPLVVRSHDHKLDRDALHEEVDTRLVKLAGNLGGTIVTNDFNLNKVAALQGVTVLNVNELANALKPVVLPGEEMRVNVIKEGKEQSQGVAYLDDGTMIVIEDGRRHIGECLDVVVTSVLQTVAGKMIFARLKGAHGDDDDGYGLGGRNRGGGGPRGKIR